MTLVIAGVSQLYQGDLDLGRRAVERLDSEDLPSHVLVEDWHYGAVAVAQRLKEIDASSLVIVGAVERGRAPGTVERKRVESVVRSPEAAQESVGDAVTGYVTVDLVLEVASALEALPARTVCVEVEPAAISPSAELTPEGAAALERALEIVRTEVRRAPLLELVDRIRPLLRDERFEPSAALDALRDLLVELRVLEEEGRWGASFALKDRLKHKIAAGETGFGMDHLDWGLWWALIEELDRLQSVEAESV